MRSLGLAATFLLAACSADVEATPPPAPLFEPTCRGEEAPPLPAVAGEEWLRPLQGVGSLQLAVGGCGHLLVAGSSSKPMDLGGGVLPAGVVVGRLDALGRHVWSRHLGELKTATLALAPSGAIILAGTFRGSVDLGDGALVSAGDGDVFVAALSPDGATLWSRSYPGEDSLATLAVGPAGEILIAGYFRGTLALGASTLVAAGISDGFVASLSATGEPRWAMRLGGPESDGIEDVAVSHSGRIALAGGTAGGLELGADVHERAFVAVFDGEGQHLASRSYADSSGAAHGTGVTFLEDEGIVFTGAFRGAMDIDGTLHQSDLQRGAGFVVRLDASGTPEWNRRMPDPATFALAVAADPVGDLVVVGSSGSAYLPDEPIEAVVTKLDAGGAVRWSRIYDAVAQGGNLVAVAPSREVLVTATFHGSIAFAGEVHESPLAAFVAAFAP